MPIIVAVIAVVVVVIALIVSFLVVTMVAPSIQVIQDVWLRVWLGPKSESSLILKRQREIDRRDGREERLGLRRRK